MSTGNSLQDITSITCLNFSFFDDMSKLTTLNIENLSRYLDSWFFLQIRSDVFRILSTMFVIILNHKKNIVCSNYGDRLIRFGSFINLSPSFFHAMFFFSFLISKIYKYKYINNVYIHTQILILKSWIENLIAKERKRQKEKETRWWKDRHEDNWYKQQWFELRRHPSVETIQHGLLLPPTLCTPTYFRLKIANRMIVAKTMPTRPRRVTINCKCEGAVTQSFALPLAAWILRLLPRELHLLE